VRARLTAGGALAALAGGLLAPAPAAAHGLVGRADLPIPEWLFGWAAATVLVVSFVGLAILWNKPELEDPRERVLFRVGPWLDVFCGVIGVAVFALVVYAGLHGNQLGTVNLAPTFIYVLFWVGVPIASAIFGDIFRAFSPWRAIARAFGFVARTFGEDRLPEPLPYPRWLGRWPAAVGIAIFAWVELAYAYRDDPSTLAILALAYAAFQLLGMALYGVEIWSDRADAFGVYFGLLARISPLARRGDDIVLRRPLSGLTSLEIVPGTIPLLCAMIGSTTFDGASQGSLWTEVAPHLQRFFSNLGASLTASIELAATLGLLVGFAVVALVYWAGVLGMRTVGGGHGAEELARRFVHSLVPIALAYAIAHYFSLLIYQGQATAFLISDPLGDGSNFFGTANSAIDYAVITATGIWYVQVAALVSGHVAGLVLAHDRALSVYGTLREASRSQRWMLVVMVAFTSLGLWLLSAANG
jgi:hypothetical protein